jgi:hypothetical protein
MVLRQEVDVALKSVCVGSVITRGCGIGSKEERVLRFARTVDTTRGAT